MYVGLVHATNFYFCYFVVYFAVCSHLLPVVSGRHSPIKHYSFLLDGDLG
jgi:hypothetical protein